MGIPYTDMGITNPEFLWLLLLLPVAVAALVAGHFSRQGKERVYGADEHLYKYGRKPRVWLDHVRSGLWLMVVLGMIATALGPYSNNTPVRVPEGSVQAVVVMDVSKSTAAEDYRENMPADAGQKPDLNKPWGRRIDMTKYQISKIMQAIEGNQLGLVTYTEQAFPQGELTRDFAALRFVVKEWVDVGSAPGNGSNYAKGLEEALLMFERAKDNSGKQKVIILISDGGFTNDKGEEVNPASDERYSKVLDALKEQGVKVVVIGVGIPGANPIPLYQDGKLQGFWQLDGKEVTTSFDADNLRAFASAAGGSYHHIDLDAASQKISVDWTREIGGSRIEMRQTELFIYFAVGTFALVFALGCLTLLRRRLS